MSICNDCIEIKKLKIKISNLCDEIDSNNRYYWREIDKQKQIIEVKEEQLLNLAKLINDLEREKRIRELSYKHDDITVAGFLNEVVRP